MADSLVDIVKKKLSSSKPEMAPDGQTLTGQKSNQVIINPNDVKLRTEEVDCCTKCKRMGCRVHKETK